MHLSDGCHPGWLLAYPRWGRRPCLPSRILQSIGVNGLRRVAGVPPVIRRNGAGWASVWGKKFCVDDVEISFRGNRPWRRGGAYGVQSGLGATGDAGYARWGLWIGSVLEHCGIVGGGAPGLVRRSLASSRRTPSCSRAVLSPFKMARTLSLHSSPFAASQHPACQA